jgi:hypothetical protein
MRAALALLLLAAAPGAAQANGYGQVFVDSFAAACVPQRLSYEGTLGHVATLGWTAAARAAHPELDAMMTIMEAGAAEAAEELQATFDYRLFSKPVEGMAHYLFVTRSSFVIGEPEPGEAPDPWVLIGCYLYNFDATAPIAPEPMTAFTGQPIARQVEQDGLVSYLWGPPCPLPRTGDSWLTYVAPDSPHVVETGFSGLMVKFETSEPDPGEVVPDTYC